MIATYRKYSALGYRCVAVNDKKAALATWKDGVTDESKYKDAYGIGIVCGFDGLECWDFDNHFADADNNLRMFISEISDLYEKYKFPIEKTVGGGYHLLLKCDEIEGNKKLAQRDKNGVADTIIETRGKGGYFVCDPTEGYKFKRGSLESVPRIEPSERQRMIEAAKLQNTWYQIRPSKEETENRPGDIFNKSTEARREAITALESAGWQDLGDKKWRRPGKDEGISASFGFVAEDIFYCFTSNGNPFEGMKAYSPFQVVTLLKYNGDFSAHAADLAKRYNLEKPQGKEFAKYQDKVISESELQQIVKRSHINFFIDREAPTCAIQVVSKEGYEPQRLFTLQNFSVIKGKQKSKKTILSSILSAAGCSGNLIEGKFLGTLPESKNQVVYVDTEQSEYDVASVGRRVFNLAKANHFEIWALREFTPLERRQIIEYLLIMYKGRVGYMIIDGVADLCKSNNDEEDAKVVSGLLMRWTKQYNTHITVVIHENKQDGYSTGHIGSEVEKKSEAVISVKKDESDPYISVVHCDLIRGVGHFEDFVIRIDNTGTPSVEPMHVGRKELTYSEKLRAKTETPF